jgi:hypothetical protein
MDEWKAEALRQASEIQRLESCLATARASIVESDKRIAEVEILKNSHKGQIDALLGNNRPWPLVDVLTFLVQATEHLLNRHDCDCHGWENHHFAAERGREYIEALRKR